MSRVWSKYQQDIFKAYNTTNKNIVIAAAPGSGKTSTIVELLKQTPPYKKAIFLCFNKSIADELSTKVPQNTKASTIHSLGIGLLYKCLNRKIKITEYKNFTLAKKSLKISHVKPDKQSAFIFTLSRMVDLYRINLGENYDDLVQINDKYGLLEGEQDLELTWELINKIDEYNLKEDHQEFMVDFTDMLFLPLFFKDRFTFPKYDVVFCDEGQDLSLLQKRLIDQIIKPRTGRFVLVGDQKQTIYTFIGANKQSFREFVEAPNTIELPLSVSYRCPKKVIEEANKVFEGVEAFEDNIEGEVIHDGDIDDAVDGDLILCRNNLPLVELFLRFLRQGKKAVIFGKEYEKGLLYILNKVDTKDKEEAFKRMDDLLKKTSEDLKAKGVFSTDKHPKYQALLEKILILKAISRSFEDFSTVDQMLSKMFSDDTSKGIILSTIHKMKGKENDTIYFYLPSLIPSKYAETAEELYQEKCLYYVCLTRSKKKLVYVNN